MAGLLFCILTIEFSNALKSTILIQYRAVVLLEGAVFLNAMACRVFRLLRRHALEENTGFSTPISPVTPAKRLRRVKTANFPGVRRRISFGHLSTPIEDDREGEQSGSILGSAFRMD